MGRVFIRSKTKNFYIDHATFYPPFHFLHLLYVIPVRVQTPYQFLWYISKSSRVTQFKPNFETCPPFLPLFSIFLFISFSHSPIVTQIKVIVSLLHQYDMIFHQLKFYQWNKKLLLSNTLFSFAPFSLEIVTDLKQ